MATFNTNKALLRAGVAGAVLAGSMTMPSVAHAASVSDLNVRSAFSANASLCVIEFDMTFTGAVADDPNRDYVQISAQTIGGTRFNGPSVQFAAPGQTTTIVEFLNLTTTSAVPDDYVVRVFDTPSGTQAANAGPQIAQVPIPRSFLLAGGSACSGLVGNLPPTVNAGADQTVTGGSTVNLSGTATDPTSDPLTLQWTQIGGPAVALSGASTTSPSFAAPPRAATPQVLTFQFSADDGNGVETDIVEITVEGNQAPNAVATGPANVTGGQSFTLDGTGSSDPESDALSYGWTQVSGPATPISNSNSPTAQITAPPSTSGNQTLVYQLSVVDSFGAVSTATVTVIVPGVNTPPTVDAGPDQTVTGGASVSLSGTANDIDSDPLTFQWTQTGGPAVTLSNPTALATGFTAPPRSSAAQVLTFELAANDGTATTTDTVEITIEANQAPTAVISGPATASGSATIVLDGTGSTDPENDPLVYQWTQVSGAQATIANPGAATTNVVLPAATGSVQTVEFQLLVADSFDAISTQTITIQIAANNAPVADAGADATFNGNESVTLDGSGSSDSDNDPLTYSWTQVSGPAVTLSDATLANPTFTTPARRNGVQNLVFELVVNDGNADSAPDQVTISIVSNTLPVPDAGPDQSVQGGSTVTLDASGTTDADNDLITYTWAQVSGPSVTLSDPAAAQPTFVAPSATGTAQTLVFRVFVSDGITNGLEGLPSDTVEITIEANRPPVADAGPDQGPIDSGQTVTLDGSGSSDPDGDGLTYSWVQLSGTAVTLSSATSASPSFTAPVVAGTESLVFQLIVSDGQTSSVADTVTIAVRAVGSVTIIQRVVGSDTSVTFTSDISALNGSIATSGGSGQLSASAVSVGSYFATAADLSAQGYALTDISCNDSDSAVDLTARRVSLALSANEDLVCTFTLTNSREAASAAIAEFLTGRNALILSHQPDLQRRLDRLTGGPGGGGSASAYGFSAPGQGKLPFDFTINADRAVMRSSLVMAQSSLGGRGDGAPAFDLWAEAYFSNARIGTQQGDFRMAYVGADYRISDGLLIGALIGFDDFNDKGVLEAGEAEGNGFLAGPYITARLAPQFFAELRAAWGSSDNRVSPLGTFADAFDTTRSFYSGSLIGQFDIGKRTLFRPEVTLRYIREEQAEYVDNLNITIPSQVVDQGDVSFRPRISHVVTIGNGWTLRPFGEVEGILTFGDASGAAFFNPLNAGPVLDLGSFRARVEGGLDLFSSGGVRMSLAGFHDGIGSDTFENTGMHVGVSFGF